MPKPQIVNVTVNKPFDGKVLLYESDASHPGGVGFLTAKNRAQRPVAYTGKVRELERSGRIAVSQVDTDEKVPYDPDALEISTDGLANLNVKQLRDLATSVELDAPANMKKAQLIDFIVDNWPDDVDVEDGADDEDDE